MNANRRSAGTWVLGTIITAGACVAGYFTRDRWIPMLSHSGSQEAAAPPVPAQNTAGESTGKFLLSDQAITNLGLVARSAKAATYWKTIQVPGMIVDRPGRSDRGIVSPVTGVVSKVHFVPGDTIRTGEVLFTIRLMSEILHQAQSDLFKSMQDIRLAEAQRRRLSEAREAIPESRVIEVENQIKRLEVAVKSYRRELINRGLSETQLVEVEQGNFISEITVQAPSRTEAQSPLFGDPGNAGKPQDTAYPSPPAFELQETKVELGQQVQAGQLLCMLANHQQLAIEGRAFRDETPLLEQSVREGWPVDVDFQENAASDWPPVQQEFHIRQLANTIDPVNRTFAFFLPIENESRIVQDGGRTQILWRFRPGQKVRLQVRVEKVENVFILPIDAVVQDGVDTFLFTQNVNTFERKSVRLITQDRQFAVVANDSAIIPGAFVVQSAAAQLNRMAKSDTSGVPKGFHIHADGSLHKNEDEGK